MESLKPWIVAAICAASMTSEMTCATVPLPSGSFVMMEATKSCPADGSGAQTTCYMTSPAQALKAVTNLQEAGVEYFMIPSATLDEAEVLAAAIDSRSAKFLSSERWTLDPAINADTGVFDCNAYTQQRINTFLIPLKLHHPESFIGLQLKDEAAQPEHANLGALVQCVRNQPILADLKIFVNLAPVNANDASLYTPNPPQGQAGAISPADFGVDCISNAIVDRSKLNAMTNRYTSFVVSALDKIKPDYIAYDLYPFNAALGTCTVAREQLMTSNSSIIAQQANVRGVVSVTYLQNYQQAAPEGNPNEPQHASFRDLRWYAAWFYAFGGRGTANFISHDEGQNFGMLDAANNPRDIAFEQQSVFGFTRQVQDALRGYSYIDFLAPWLGVPSGSFVGWLPSQDIMASEYSNPTNGTDIVIFVTRPNGPVAPATSGLNNWRTKVEKLNFGTGLWETVGQSTNAINIDFGDLPAAVYRLTD